MYPGVICSAVHAATRCAFAITTLHPGSNLKYLAYEEGKKRGSLQVALVKNPSGSRREKLAILSFHVSALLHSDAPTTLGHYGDTLCE